MSKFLKFTLVTGFALSATATAIWAGEYGLGRPALPEEIAAWDVKVMPDGRGLPEGSGDVWTGDEVFGEHCAVCHGDDGTGDIYQGAPNLTDAIWLYGGDYDTVKETVINSRFGVMPPMGGAQLTEAKIRAVATYVHQLGGGE